MRNLTIAITALAFSALAIAQQLKIPSQASGNHQTLCTGEWTKRGVLDQNMFSFCMRRQTDGYLSLVNLANKYNNRPWIQAAVNHSINNWTKRGARDDRMVYYTLNKMIDGFEDLAYMSKQPGWNQAKHDGCYAKWGVQFDMVSYCYNR